MQSTYTPYTLTTVMPGVSGVPAAGGGDDGFMEMAKTLFRRRMQQSEQDRRKRPGEFERAVNHAAAAPAMSPNVLGGGGGGWRDDHERLMAREQLIAARERNAPLPEKTFFSMNASSNPNGPMRVPDWSKVSLGNLPANGGFSQSAQMAAAGDQGLSDARKARFDETTAAGELANTYGGSPDEVGFEQQLRRLLAARGRMG